MINKKPKWTSFTPDRGWEALPTSPHHPTYSRHRSVPAKCELHPHIGHADVLVQVEEYQVETLCVGVGFMRDAVKALRKAHTYEQVVVEVIQLVQYRGS